MPEMQNKGKNVYVRIPIDTIVTVHCVESRDLTTSLPATTDVYTRLATLRHHQLSPCMYTLTPCAYIRGHVYRYILTNRVCILYTK